MPPTVLTHAPRHASAPTAFTPARYRGAPLLSAAGRHLVARFSYGVTPSLTDQVKAAGGANAWFERQLRPSNILDPDADALLSRWPSLAIDAATLLSRLVSRTENGPALMASYLRWLLMRRITTRRQVHEVMTEFWLNHLNVPVHSDPVFTYRFDYDRVVRTHALGRFDDLLHAAITHPAMGMYLDNATSTKTHPNENLGRELLELHTVGRGAYTEDDVKASARILTGYLVDAWDTWEAHYSPEDHWTGRVRVMGFTHANTSSDGRAVVRKYLTYLARHPSTARRIATKLAIAFVSDRPSTALIDKLSAVYLASDTAIPPVLRALVASKEFKQSAHAKVREPAADVVATYRALGAQVAPPLLGTDAAAALVWQAFSVGAVPHEWPRPDGPPADNTSWSAPGRLLGSLRMHYAMAGSWWPNQGVTYRAPAAWLPAPSIRFDLLVDHLSQQLHAQHSSATLLEACCRATGLSPSETITPTHTLVRWTFPRLLTVFLDCPEHLSH